MSLAIQYGGGAAEFSLYRVVDMTENLQTVRYRWKTSIQKDGKQQLRHWLFMLKKEKQKEPSPRIRLE